ncbi:MAG TPA: hypothetical protein PLL69_03535 [Gemmatimonadales bacterium]|nr:hypothetical protein [Gemmatimonadales bacterium]
MSGELLVLRLVHVLGGIFWVGGMMYANFFLAPALRQAGPAAATVMAGLQQRKAFVWLPVIALITILAGIRLMMISSLGFQPAYFAAAPGKVYLAAGTASVIALVVGLAVVRPGMQRMAGIGARIASAPESERAAMQAEMARLGSRGAAMQALVTWLLIFAAAGMAVGRYV